MTKHDQPEPSSDKQTQQTNKPNLDHKTHPYTWSIDLAKQSKTKRKTTHTKTNCLPRQTDDYQSTGEQQNLTCKPLGEGTTKTQLALKTKTAKLDSQNHQKKTKKHNRRKKKPEACSLLSLGSSSILFSPISKTKNSSSFLCSSRSRSRSG